MRAHRHRDARLYAAPADDHPARPAAGTACAAPRGGTLSAGLHQAWRQVHQVHLSAWLRAPRHQVLQHAWDVARAATSSRQQVLPDHPPSCPPGYMRIGNTCVRINIHVPPPHIHHPPPVIIGRHRPLTIIITGDERGRAAEGIGHGNGEHAKTWRENGGAFWMAALRGARIMLIGAHRLRRARRARDDLLRADAASEVARSDVLGERARQQGPGRDRGLSEGLSARPVRAARPHQAGEAEAARDAGKTGAADGAAGRARKAGQDDCSPSRSPRKHKPSGAH